MIVCSGLPGRRAVAGVGPLASLVLGGVFSLVAWGLVASPDLIRVSCRTPHQMTLVNALCRAWEEHR